MTHKDVKARLKSGGILNPTGVKAVDNYWTLGGKKGLETFIVFQGLKLAIGDISIIRPDDLYLGLGWTFLDETVLEEGSSILRQMKRAMVRDYANIQQVIQKDYEPFLFALHQCLPHISKPTTKRLPKGLRVFQNRTILRQTVNNLLTF